MAAESAQPRVVRAFVNGCWDLLHCGHFNAFRQARDAAAALVDGDDSRVILVIGVHPNDEIRRVKGGAFVTSEVEKEAVLRACKFVDEVVHNIPYGEMCPELLDQDNIRCDIALHGDDQVILPTGVGMYTQSRDAGRYIEFPLTEGISTTHLIDRLLTIAGNTTGEVLPLSSECCALTARRISAFSRLRDPTNPPSGELVYIDGDFDMFHGGHVEVLRRAKEQCGQLVVGIHGADSIRQYRGTTRPLMTSGERSLAILACRYADDVVLDAPVRPNQDFFKALRVKAVLRVIGHEDFAGEDLPTLAGRWAAAEEMGLMRELPIDRAELTGAQLLTTGGLVERVA